MGRDTISAVISFLNSSSELSGQEVYGLSCILRRLATTFSVVQFGSVGVAELESLIQSLTHLTCLSARKTAEEQVRPSTVNNNNNKAVQTINRTV